MKDLIAKLQMDANCALGAIWMHIDAQAARIAELEAKIAAVSAPEVEQQTSCAYCNKGTCYKHDDDHQAADSDKLREALKLAVRQNSCDMLMTGEEIRKCEAALNSTALQAPVSEVPEGWQLVPKEPTAEMCLVFDDYDMSARQIYTGMLAAAPSHKEA